MDVPAARSAAEASTFCAGEVIGVQREALPLLLWKKVSTPPVGQMIGALSNRLEAVAAAATALANYGRRNVLDENESSRYIKLLEDAEASFRFIVTGVEDLISQRSRRDATLKDLERILEMLLKATEAIQDARWTLMVVDGLQGPTSETRYGSGSELVAASLAR